MTVLIVLHNKAASGDECCLVQEKLSEVDTKIKTPPKQMAWYEIILHFCICYIFIDI